MTPNATGVTTTWSEVIVGFAFALVTGAIAYLVRADASNAERAEELVREAREEARAENRDRERDLSAAIAAFQEHRGLVLGSMVTKTDLAAMEQRIMAAIRNRPPVRDDAD